MTGCRSGCHVKIRSYHDVILYRFFSCPKVCSCMVGYTVAWLDTHLHGWIHSCMVGYTVAWLDTQLHGFLLSGYTVAWFSIIWIHSCMVFYYLGIQLHGDQSIQYCAQGEIRATTYLFVQLRNMTL